MTRTVDLSHLVFVDLLQNLVDTTGTKVAKGNLMRIAMKAGKKVASRDYVSIDEFVDAMESGDTPLSFIEGNTKHLGSGVFGLELCPFGSLAQNYRNYFDKDPASFCELTDEFNAENPMAKEMKIGLGAGVGPFCIFHQPMRSKAGTKITIGGKPVEIVQLACRSASAEKAYSQTLIAEFGCEKEIVVKAMDTYTCCYGVRVKGS